jgi:hypothetical protein
LSILIMFKKAIIFYLKLLGNFRRFIAVFEVSIMF